MVGLLQVFVITILDFTEHMAKISLCHELGRGSEILALILAYYKLLCPLTQWQSDKDRHLIATVLAMSSMQRS